MELEFFVEEANNPDARKCVASSFFIGNMAWLLFVLNQPLDPPGAQKWHYWMDK